MKKMMKKSICLFLTLLLLFLFASCGKDKTDYIADLPALADKILEEIPFQAEVSALDADMISYYFSTENETQAIVYMGDGATADEFGLFCAKDIASADALKNNIDAYLKDQADSFAKYIPAQTDRIKKAHVSQKGCYVVFCVSEDNNAFKKLTEDAITAK